MVEDSQVASLPELAEKQVTFEVALESLFLFAGIRWLLRIRSENMQNKASFAQDGKVLVTCEGGKK